jgi:hypothetical protein
MEKARGGGVTTHRFLAIGCGNSGAVYVFENARTGREPTSRKPGEKWGTQSSAYGRDVFVQSSILSFLIREKA